MKPANTNVDYQTTLLSHDDLLNMAEEIHDLCLNTPSDEAPDWGDIYNILVDKLSKSDDFASKVETKLKRNTDYGKCFNESFSKHK